MGSESEAAGSRWIPGWVRHAFSLAPPDAEPTPPQCAAADAICRLIVQRQMAPAALAFLEASRPLNYLGAQALHFGSPFGSLLVDAEAYQHFAQFLERRDAVEWLCRRIEVLQATSQQQQQQAQAQ